MPKPRKGRRPPPQALDERSSKAGLRAVAIFEAVKGGAVLLLGLGILGLLHKDVEDLAERLLDHLHVDPGRHLSQVFLEAAAKVTDARLLAMSAAAAAYSTVRFVEAWGLWNRRVWAEWFALLSGALYLPWEVLKVVEKPSPGHIGVLVVNLAILAYMAYVRFMASRRLPEPG